MGKREKILVAIMAAAIFYGGVEFFYLSGETKGEAHSQVDIGAVGEVVRMLDQGIHAVELNEHQRYALQTADVPWRNDFIHVLPENKAIVSETPSTDQSPAHFNYTGYIEVGNRRLAIVNGMEYQVGETLKGGVYVLRRITPGNLIIEKSQNRGEIVVPYSE